MVKHNEVPASLVFVLTLMAVSCWIILLGTEIYGIYLGVIAVGIGTWKSLFSRRW